MEKKMAFQEWLEDAKWLLPPKMTALEAFMLFERKTKEEEEMVLEIATNAPKTADTIRG